MKDFDFKIPISKNEITVGELIEILTFVGFKVEDFWGGTVDGRCLKIKKGGAS
jgi:hypothetical protein